MFKSVCLLETHDCEVLGMCYTTPNPLYFNSFWNTIILHSVFLGKGLN